MKKRIFLMLTLCLLTCLAGKGYASSVVCQNLPSSVTTGTSFLILFECNIAANSVPVGKSLRVTTNLHAVNSGTKGVDSCLVFNGNFVTCANTIAQSEEQNWSFIVTNVGGTGFAIGGTTMAGQNRTLALGPATVNHPAAPWSSNWYLQIEVAFTSGTYTVDGDTFLVELIE